MPVQDYPPRDKVCDYHEKTASSSPTAKDCQARWRGGPPLISCREMLNAGAHSPPYPHTQGNTMTHTHIVTRMLMLILMCTKPQNAICSSCSDTHTHKQRGDQKTARLLTHISYSLKSKPSFVCLYDKCKRLKPVWTEYETKCVKRLFCNQNHRKPSTVHS